MRRKRSTRKRRIWYPGATYHVTSRGIRRSVICTDKKDFNIFMMVLKSTMEKMPFQLHCFCMMTNHLHLLLTTEETNIGRIMCRILGNYARNFNERYGYKGHLFEERYASGLIKTNEHLLEVSRYIHMNPVKAGIVDKPEDYPYSSYPFYVSDAETPLLEKKIILDNFGGNSINYYKDYVESDICV